MLDDLKYIHDKDSSDALGYSAKQWQQLEATYDFPKLDFPIENVVFAGMGGSSLWAMLSLSWPGYSVPFEIWRRYDAPTYLSEKTLVIVNSYSGSTEETLSAMAAAEKANAQVVAVARGGKVIEIAKKNKYPYIMLPETPQPRLGTLSGFKSLVTIMQSAGLIKQKDIEKILQKAAKFLKHEVAEWAPDVPVSKNPAKQLALEIAGTTPIIYAGTAMMPAAYKWKIAFNEAAKNVAWYNEVPEFSHNEFVSWSSHPVDKPYSVIDLRSSFEHPRVKKRFELTERLLSGKRPHAHTVEAEGSNALEQMLYLTIFGDFVSIYVALLNGLDPTPLELVDKFKEALKN